jgi:Ca-activated chloride channel family protein
MRARSWLGLLGVMVLSACGSAGGGAGGSGSPIAVDPFDPGQGGYGYGGGSYGGGDSGPGAPPVPTTSDEPPPEAPLGCEELDPEIALVLYLSADDSNSMATPARARELLRDGIFPHGLGARPYEFLNYYDVAYPAPPTGQLGLHAVASPGSSPETYELQLAVRAFDALPERRPMTLTFVLDASGSMEGEPLNRERAAVLAIASQLREGDIVNMVTWDTSNNVVLAGHAVEGPSDATLVEAAQGLSASGGTDLEGGLAMGYQLATQHYGPARLNRVILISDGGANVGVTSAELIAQHSADGDEESIYLVGVGAGGPRSTTTSSWTRSPTRGEAPTSTSTQRMRPTRCSGPASTRPWRSRPARCRSR